MKEKSGWQEQTVFFLSLILGSLLLLLPALYNHYPLVNPDTATYLASGFKPETPFDRPITYGLLIRLFTLNGQSLWLLVFAQAVIVCWLIFRIVDNIGNGKQTFLKGLLVILFLATCSSLSWIVSQVQPDVFTSIGFLCIVLLLMGKESKGNEIALYALFFVCVAVHLSHPFLFFVSLLLLLLLRKMYAARESYGRLSRKILVLVLLSISSLAIMGAALSKSKHVFFVGSLLEKGVLKKYLDDNCATKNYKICAYKDSLPASANDFWWDPHGPLYKSGDWKGSRQDFNDIAHGVLTTPAYLKFFLTASAKQTWEQAVTFNIGDGNTSFPPGSNVHQRIEAYFAGETGTFNAAVQNMSRLQDHLVFANRLFRGVVVVSLLVLVLSMISWRRLPRAAKLLLLVCISGAVINVADCALFGIVNGRYGCKMIWLLPLCGICMVFANWDVWRRKTGATNNSDSHDPR